VTGRECSPHRLTVGAAESLSEQLRVCGVNLNVGSFCPRCSSQWVKSAHEKRRLEGSERGVCSNVAKQRDKIFISIPGTTLVICNCEKIAFSFPPYESAWFVVSQALFMLEIRLTLD
jgi:hypothetical protein